MICFGMDAFGVSVWACVVSGVRRRVWAWCGDIARASRLRLHMKTALLAQKEVTQHACGDAL